MCSPSGSSRTAFPRASCTSRADRRGSSTCCATSCAAAPTSLASPVQDGWSLVVDAFDPDAGRSHEALLTIADGVIGTNGAPLLAHPAARPELVAAGVYDGEGPETDLLAGPRWAALDAGARARRPRAARARSAHRSARRRRRRRGPSCSRCGSPRSPGPESRCCAPTSIRPSTPTPLRLRIDRCCSAVGRPSASGWRRAGSVGSITAAAWQKRDGHASRSHRRVRRRATDGPEPDRAAASLADARARGVRRACSPSTAARGRAAGSAPTCASRATTQLQLRGAARALPSDGLGRRPRRGRGRRARAHGPRVPRARVLGRRPVRAPVPRRDRARGRAGDARVPVPATAGRARGGARRGPARARGSRGSRPRPAST